MAAEVRAPVRRLARPVIGVLAGACGVAAVVAVERSVPGLTSYAGASTAAHAADLAAGLGLLVAGAFACYSTTTRMGVLVVLLGVAWFVPDFEGWNHGPVVARSLGAAAAPLLPAVLLHLVASAPSGRLRSRLALAGVAGAYTVAGTAVVGRALFRDPFLETTCWRSCIENALLVHGSQNVTGALNSLMLYSALAFGVGAAAIALTRLLHARHPARRALTPVLAPAVVAASAGAAYAAALIRTPLEDPARTDFAMIFLTRAVALTALAAGVAALAVRSQRTRGSLRRLAGELKQAPAPGRLEEALRATLGDPTLRIAYHVGRGNRYVDSNGERLDVAASSLGRAVTPIVRASRPIALVLHDPAVAEFADQIGPAARLAVDNERLRAELLFQLEELRSSRVRIVDAADAARRRLERDLHDGAQQRLLALSYDLRVAAAGAAASGESKLAAAIAAAAEQARSALVELRDLAHGIYPAILTEAGLGPAIANLGDEAPIPLVIRDLPAARHPAVVETAAFVCIADAIADAARRRASYAEVDVHAEDGSLTVSVTDDGAARTGGFVHLVDRIGALNGQIDTGPTSFLASIPCA